jgi:hypothetical protein
VHSFSVGVMLDCGTTIALFPFCKCIMLVTLCNYGARAMFVFFELLVSKQRNLCLLWKVLCDQPSWTYSHVMLWLHKNRVHGLCSLCGCSVESYFFLWLVQHVGALPKVIQGPCLVSRDDVYMGT